MYILPQTYQLLSNLPIVSAYKGAHVPLRKIFRISILHTPAAGSAVPACIRLELQKIFLVRPVSTGSRSVRAGQKCENASALTSSGFNTAIAPLTCVKTARALVKPKLLFI